MLLLIELVLIIIKNINFNVNGVMLMVCMLVELRCYG